ncbi:class I SAM-dependent methyltransferase [Goodfellowiella coeruleoviolacea]|uniref:Phospholipid N-methyltransferase n=1 Tax=Goodfellowiella coeruleoviolacea TaxID=334858 RepID=A0AAE3GGE2_9PSEU|nr:methyltransferase domain-containing protein [Goodfellowiella coeruleoviolacea]MCP2167771.1 Phospholipid N-methyltransferase [Goodfellowiella coeruleoviolacea]
MGFVREFLRDPRRTGAVAPSTPWAARTLVAEADPAGARVVVEVGAGTGAITNVLLPRVPPGGHLLAVEVNPVFAARLRRRFGADEVAVVCASAVHLRAALAEHGVSSVDRVISALPWTTMPDGQQEDILAAVAGVLASDGRFSTLLCRHRIGSAGARRFLDLLHRHFGRVWSGRTVWAAVPPLVAYHCADPVRGG